MSTRLFEFDGGAGDRHEVLFDGREWHGWENLFMHLPGYARPHSRGLLLQSALRGESKYDIYEILERPVPEQFDERIVRD